MPTVHREARVPYAPAQMFDLVNDIESYPRFVPWCRAAWLVERSDSELKARLTLAKGKIEKSFTTRNRLRPHDRIDVSLVEGPFRHLDGHWQFAPTDGGTRIILDLEFELKNRLWKAALGPVFAQVANTLVDAFVRRAAEVYDR